MWPSKISLDARVFKVEALHVKHRSLSLYHSLHSSPGLILTVDCSCMILCTGQTAQLSRQIIGSFDLQRI